jgi:hypothetical protein
MIAAYASQTHALTQVLANALPTQETKVATGKQELFKLLSSRFKLAKNNN